MKISTKVNNLKNYRVFLQVEEAVHDFMQKHGYLKIDLPVLSPVLIPESYLEVFETEFRYLKKKEKLYLTPSPELFLKRLLIAGIGNCYYLGKAFRNSEPSSDLHSFEFTMLEYYKVNADYMDLAEELLEMLRLIAAHCHSGKRPRVVGGAHPESDSGQGPIQSDQARITIKYQRNKIALVKWEKLTVAQAFRKYARVTDKELFNHHLFLKKAKQKGYKIEGFTYEEVWSQIYTQEVEPHLGMNGYPTLIYDYPKEFAALAKLNPDGRTAQRFEFYIAGVELGDCYTELTDWKEQERRFKKEVVSHPIDKGFIEALKLGLGPCAGIAIGFDRLVMIFADVASIGDLKLITVE